MKKQEENEKMNFSQKDFLTVIRKRLSLKEDFISDEELLTMSIETELGLDSLDYVQVLSDIQQAMHIRLYLEEEEQFGSFQDMWDYISSKTHQ